MAVNIANVYYCRVVRYFCFLGWYVLMEYTDGHRRFSAAVKAAARASNCDSDQLPMVLNSVTASGFILRPLWAALGQSMPLVHKLAVAL
ncbi:hypothetical protein An15g04710 [Aspergillus niger]|uniref:Uncharacterized protein n=2 Tax=Aspergillus niger TaxID=5061 RepID=A2R5L3_ASPNC|nr:hypothetical protein An15g04710 [Aspergillus niger]CAK42449.1 hypothetical protein An15g04710 [Aspergillus niger]